MRKLFSTTYLAFAAALLAASCRSTQATYQFTPSPLEVQVVEGEGQPSIARVLVSVTGAEREGKRQSGLPELIVRLRIENQSAEAIHFDPSRSSLLGSDLAEFGAAKTEPAGVISILAGNSKSVLVRYPFPQDGSLEAPLLTGVNLRLELDIYGGVKGTHSVELSASLDRVNQRDGYDDRNGLNWGLGYRGYYGGGYPRSYNGSYRGGFGRSRFGFGRSSYGCW